MTRFPWHWPVKGKDRPKSLRWPVLLLVVFWGLVIGAAFLLAGCADGYDRSGYKLPGDCAEAARLTADVPVIHLQQHELTHLVADAGVKGVALHPINAASSYGIDASGKPVKSTARIYMLNTLDPAGGQYASSLCHERFHVLLGAWHP